MSSSSPVGSLTADAGPAPSTTNPPAARCAPEVTEATRNTVRDALTALFIDGKANPTQAIQAYWADPYVQHNPAAMSGVAAFSSFFSVINFDYELIRVLADCDLGVAHGRYSGTGVIFDMFRVEGGKLVEHWDSDSGQGSPPDGPIEITDTDATETNRAAVLDVFDSSLIPGDFDVSLTAFSDQLVEHHGAMSLGQDAFISMLETDKVSYEQTHHVIADGNFVFLLSEGAVNGKAYGLYDLFRLEAGQIAEHWDSRRQVPTSTASGEGIF